MIDMSCDAVHFSVITSYQCLVFCRYAGPDYEGKEMSSVQHDLSTSFSGAASADGLKAHFARLALSLLPRGLDADNIINISMLKLLRSNGIKEGDRPGIEFHSKPSAHMVQFIECHFLDQVRCFESVCLLGPDRIGFPPYSSVTVHLQSS